MTDIEDRSSQPGKAGPRVPVPRETPDPIAVALAFAIREAVAKKEATTADEDPDR